MIQTGSSTLSRYVMTILKTIWISFWYSYEVRLFTFLSAFLVQVILASLSLSLPAWQLLASAIVAATFGCLISWSLLERNQLPFLFWRIPDANPSEMGSMDFALEILLSPLSLICFVAVVWPVEAAITSGDWQDYLLAFFLLIFGPLGSALRVAFVAILEYAGLEPEK